MKRIMTVQDISCLGKCSLTAALPVISAMGVETCVIPTAVLSTHTGFDGFTFHDLTDEIDPIRKHWEKEHFKFDAIYTGYLGSYKQIALVSKLFDSFKTDDNLIIIDPVMGDHGKLYPGFDKSFPEYMRTLCQKADVILPNMTEATYLLDIDYKEYGYDEEYIKSVLIRLCDLGVKISVLTGVSFDNTHLGVMSYNRETNRFFSCFNEKIDAQYHGTGDIFASCFTGALMNGMNSDEALRLAADFTSRCIANTNADKNSSWYGVRFEYEIPYLVHRLENFKNT